MKLIKVISKDTKAIKGRTYVAIKKDNTKTLTLTHVLASDRLVQLYNSVVIDNEDVLVVDNKEPSLAINTNPNAERTFAAHDPYNTRKDVYSGDCNDCRTQLDYCGALHVWLIIN